jgi:hypothetical protein
MEIYGSDIRGGVFHEGGSSNGWKLPRTTNSPCADTVRETHHTYTRSIIMRSIKQFPGVDAALGKAFTSLGMPSDPRQAVAAFGKCYKVVTRGVSQAVSVL